MTKLPLMKIEPPPLAAYRNADSFSGRIPRQGGGRACSGLRYRFGIGLLAIASSQYCYAPSASLARRLTATELDAGRGAAGGRHTPCLSVCFRLRLMSSVCALARKGCGGCRRQCWALATQVPNTEAREQARPPPDCPKQADGGCAQKKLSHYQNSLHVRTRFCYPNI